MSFLSNLVKQVAPIVATVSPDPITKGIATAATIQYQNQEANYQRKLAEQREAQRRKNMPINYGGNFDPVSGTGMPSTTTQQAGMGGFFGGVTDFFKGAGEVIGSAFGSGIPQLLGVSRPRGVGQQPAITTVTNVGAQESQGSGSIQAGMGSLLPSLVSGARGLIKSPVGQFLTGTGIGTAVSMLGADGKPMRVTRKMKAQARMLLNMTGGNLAMTADFLGISEQQLVFILLKRFRNDGPVVTKAALRKTKSTIRKMKNMCDMYDDLRPAARRRTPMRRATRSSTTLIKN
tara:strand:- start:665 stop:1534 length:870 start_codon:yes stop_codon:yes gene_type:complete